MKQKSRLYLTKGLPASGKSTWAREFVENSNGKVINVCKDDLRDMLHADKHSSGRETFVMQIRDIITIKAFEDNKSVIWSDTNLNPIHEIRAKELAEQYNVVLEIKDFTDVPVEECIKRDLKRLKSVGEKVIRESYNRYLKKIDQKIPQNQTQNKDLPKAIICDLDGTLAKLNGRNPYDASRCENDLLNEGVASIVKSYYKAGYQLLLVSGRESRFREQTENWLKLHNIEYNQLIMRQTSDVRKDSIIKREIYDNHIKDNYYIEFILDDRNQVVDMWRDLGLTCLQVDYGDF